jgi:hypothetical protein
LPLKIHAGCHAVALATFAAAILGEWPWLAEIGAIVGLVGAAAFAWFVASLIFRMAHPLSRGEPQAARC